MCIGWGSRPTWNGSHIHLKHVQGVWQCSYAVYGQMDPSLCRYHRTCWPRFGNLNQNLGLKLGCKSYQCECAVVEAPPQACTMCLTMFICCGWADGSITMSLPPHLPTQILEYSDNLGSSCWALNDSIVKWFTLQTHLEWFPNAPKWTKTTLSCCHKTYSHIGKRQHSHSNSGGNSISNNSSSRIAVADSTPVVSSSTVMANSSAMVADIKALLHSLFFSLSSYLLSNPTYRNTVLSCRIVDNYLILLVAGLPQHDNDSHKNGCHNEMLTTCQANIIDMLATDWQCLSFGGGADRQKSDNPSQEKDKYIHRVRYFFFLSWIVMYFKPFKRGLSVNKPLVW